MKEDGLGVTGFRLRVYSLGFRFWVYAIGLKVSRLHVWSLWFRVPEILVSTQLIRNFKV